jgi:low temperature requirement protein LtrA
MAENEQKQPLISASVSPVRESSDERVRELSAASIKKRICLQFWDIPELRENFSDQPQELDWLELFYDLIFVAALTNLSSHVESLLLFSEKSIANSLGTSFLYFLCFWSVWSNASHYWTRFAPEDLFTQIIFFFYYGGVYGMSICLQEDFQDRLGFALSFAACKLCLAVLYAQVLLNSKTREFAKFSFPGCMINVLVLIASAFTLPEVSVFLWIFTCLVDQFWVSCTYLESERAIPLNIHYVARRNHILMMLVLGACVISVALGSSIKTSHRFIVVYSAFALLFCLRYLYVAVSPQDPEKHAARRRSKTALYTYNHSHLFAGASLLGVGVGAKQLIVQDLWGKKEMQSRQVAVLTTSLGLYLVFLNLIRLAHNYKKRLITIWSLRFFIIALILGYPAYAHHQSAAGVLLIQVLFCTVLVLSDNMGTAINDQLYELEFAAIGRARPSKLKEKSEDDDPESQTMEYEELSPRRRSFRRWSFFKRQKSQKHIEDTCEL